MATTKKPAAKAAPAKTTKPAAKTTAKPAAKAAPAKTTKPAAKEVPAKKAPFGRGTTTGAKKPVRAKRKPVLFAAPADFKPHFLMLQAKTEKDGLFCSNMVATRYVGRYDPEADERKKFNLADYDPRTLCGIAARLSAITFKATQDRFYEPSAQGRVGIRGAHRLPKSTQFNILMRVGMKKADGSLTCRVVSVEQPVKKTLKSGKTKTVMIALEKTDPVWRLIRRASRILPAAFENVLMPPKRTRASRRAEQADEE